MVLLDKILRRLNLSETKQKIVRNLFWAVTGKVVTLLGSLLVGIFVARYLGPEQYGLMQYVISYVALFQVFASFGLDNIEIREEAKCRSVSDTTVAPTYEINRIIGTAFYLKLLFAAITICAVIATAWLFEADTFTRWMIGLYALSMVCQTFNVIRNYFTAIIWNEYIVKTEISRTVIGAFIKVVLLLLHAPLGYFIAATLFDTVLIAGGYLLSYRKKIGTPRAWTFDVPTAKYILKESFPLLLSGAAVVIYQRIDQVMIGNILDKSSVGFYSVSNSFVGVIGFIPVILSQTISPILVQAYNTNRQDYRQKAQQFMNVTFWLTTFICVVVALCASPIVRWTFGDAYIPAISILQVAVFRELFLAQAHITGTLIVTEQIQKYVVIRNVLACLVCVAGNYFLLPSVGVMGAAWCSILSAIMAGVLTHLFIPMYRHLFRMQLQSFFIGWKDMFALKKIIKL